MADILIVDDDEDDRVQLGAILETLGQELHYAASGESAFRLYLDRRIDVVVTDISMPNGSGIELIAGLKASNPNVSIVAVSGKGGGGLSAARVVGADAALAKPVAPAELVKIVRDALSVENGRPCPYCGTAGRHLRTFSGLLCRECGRLFSPALRDVGQP